MARIHGLFSTSKIVPVVTAAKTPMVTPALHRIGQFAPQARRAVRQTKFTQAFVLLLRVGRPL